MEAPVHRLNALFDQLGLPSDRSSIEQFIETHAPLDNAIALPDAPFWTPAQSAFLREEWHEDADWCEVVDELNVRLRRH